ncbi:MAG TPA: UDP-N-acetylmuramate--L-alanine ligase [Candidatus Eremiobacteraceae bacterium]|nr:UDP-N-acetylmuramate--L-alanine ligase [Candidatus Eremiobacteraceae bacterium]
MKRLHRHVHFVGIGGIGMSAIARVLLALGVGVSGSDLKLNGTLEKLRGLGATVTLGHASENIKGADAVVISSAIPLDNPEVIAAQKAGIRVMQRAEMLAEIMADKRGIAVSGTHGKTTTTSMIAAVLDAGGFAPTVLIGGEVNDLGANARLGAGDIVVAEADESDASFLRLNPNCAVVTNIENDHLGYYRDLEHLIETFTSFIERVPPAGCIVASPDCPAVGELLRRFCQSPSLLGDPAIITAGFDVSAHFRAVDPELADFGSSFTLQTIGETLGEITLRVPGRINISNALLAVAVGLRFGVTFEVIARALARFRGVARRFQVLYDSQSLLVVDDYAHHPTAVQETIAAARAYWPGRIVVAFQPHRYSRTAYLMRDFARSLLRADEVVVADIYPAGELPLPGVRSESIVDFIRDLDADKKVTHLPKPADVLAYLQRTIKTGDLVLTLGAGDIGGVAHELAAGLSAADAGVANL